MQKNCMLFKFKRSTVKQGKDSSLCFHKIIAARKLSPLFSRVNRFLDIFNKMMTEQRCSRWLSLITSPSGKPSPALTGLPWAEGDLSAEWTAYFGVVNQTHSLMVFRLTLSVWQSHKLSKFKRANHTGQRHLGNDVSNFKYSHTIRMPCVLRHWQKLCQREQIKI